MTDQQESVVLEFLAKAVIENESNSVRFENFCNEVIGKYAGITILPTSVSWDMGRDGRAITRDHSVATATSLRGDVDAKMVGDLQRMLPDLTTPARLYFCTSEYRSGYAIANLERTLRDLCPAGVTPFALGLKELVELGTRWPTSFLKFYTADYAELVTTLQSGQNATAETQDEALRLALSLFDNPDSAQLREGSYRTLILRVLQLKGACTVRELSSSASTLLRLGRPLPEVSLDSRLPKMIADGLIERVGVRYDTTPKGKDEIHNIDASIATQIIVGRAQV
jgi:DNA-binding HxlR family transcriptional regulator